MLIILLYRKLILYVTGVTLYCMGNSMRYRNLRNLRIVQYLENYREYLEIRSIFRAFVKKRDVPSIVS